MDGAPQLNLSSADEHVPEARASHCLLHSFYNAPGTGAYSHVLFVAKQLNLFPVKGRVSAHLSPKQIMSGEVADYKYCNMGFGRYCQIHEEDQPQNS